MRSPRPAAPGRAGVPRRDGRRRILLYFLLGVALPSAVFGFLAFRGIQNDRAVVERERMRILQAGAAAFEAAAGRRLDEIGRALSSASDAEVRRMVEEEPVVEGVFRFDSGTVRIVAAEGMFFIRHPPGAGPPINLHPAVASAWADELRGELDGALEAYRRHFERTTDDRERAQALAGVARVERRFGRTGEAAEAYARLTSGFGTIPSPTGLPFGPAAALEAGLLHMESADTGTAVAQLLHLYGDLIDGRWALSPAQFDLLATSTREALESAVTGALAGAVDTLRILEDEEERRRERAQALMAFEVEVERLLPRYDDSVRQAVVEVVGASFPVRLLPPPSEEGPVARRGLIVDLAALADAAYRDARSGGHATSWVLTTPAGARSTSPADPAPGSPSLTTAFAGFTGWRLDLALTAAATDGSLLASRRALYFWAFGLIACILLFGLALTMRTVGRELELARMKSNFVSTVSHEFRSPLTAIRQIAEALEGGRVPTEERKRRYYGVLLEQSERLSTLIDNVLTLSRMEAGRHRLRFEPTDVAALVDGVVADARHRVAHEGFTIRTEIDRRVPRLRVDADAVRQALGNLIDNGVKYSGASRDLVVRGYPENGEVVLAVRDFGIGLSAEEAGRVFERFYRAGNELTRTVKGTGLGLTLVKEIAETHGGRVGVRSRPGEGSTFFLRLSLDGPATEPSEEVPE